MFGFVKELMLIGLVSNTIGKVVKNCCGTDFVKELSVKGQNNVADKTIKTLEKARGYKIKEINEDNFDDLIIVGFLMLANELGVNQATKHQLVLIGLMGYLSNAIERKAQITVSILLSAKTYLENHEPRSH
jgi:hypothetical protein